MQKHYTEEEVKEHLEIVGGFVSIRTRKWWNPLRYIKGKFYFVTL